MMYASSNIGPGRGFVTITPGPAPLAHSVRMLRVGTGGTVIGKAPDGSQATFTVSDGEYLLGEFTHVLTGSTATNLVGYV